MVETQLLVLLAGAVKLRKAQRLIFQAGIVTGTIPSIGTRTQTGETTVALTLDMP